MAEVHCLKSEVQFRLYSAGLQYWLRGGGEEGALIDRCTDPVSYSSRSILMAVVGAVFL